MRAAQYHNNNKANAINNNVINKLFLGWLVILTFNRRFQSYLLLLFNSVFVQYYAIGGFTTIMKYGSLIIYGESAMDCCLYSILHYQIRHVCNSI